jgi:hypothetical protein
MPLDPIQQKQIMDLLILSLEGQAGNDDLQKLRDILDSSSEARNYYLKAVLAAESIREMDWQAEDFANETDGCEGFDTNFWKALAEEEKSAPVIEIAAPQEPQIPIQKIPTQNVVRKISKRSLFTLFTAAAAIVLIFVFARFAPLATGIKVAVLADCINAKWANMNGVMEKGTPIFTSHENLLLREGIIELLFDNQARVVIESPAEFTLLSSDQIRLQYGKVYAMIPREAIGFTINTPTARIIDLGTEFGVGADVLGDTRLYVMKGKTTLIAGEKLSKVSMEVNAGSAKNISGETRAVSDITFRKDVFVRNIDSDKNLIWKGQTGLDLADMVGGGNGLGTGRQFSALTIDDRIMMSDAPRMLMTSTESANYKIHSNSLIDLLFIPKGKTQICSQRSIFMEFPNTAGSTFGCVTNGGIVAGPGDGWNNPVLLGGKEYGRPGSPMIHMHSNMGITFDLNQIRQSIPGLKIVGFSSLCGITETAQQMPGYNSAVHSWVDFWVLVDGVVQFKKEHVSLTSGPIPIDIKLNANDRYLSLAVTDSDGSILFDWSIFAAPRLEVIFSDD